MNGNTVRDQLNDLVDVLDRLLKEHRRIAECLENLEEYFTFEEDAP